MSTALDPGSPEPCPLPAAAIGGRCEARVLRLVVFVCGMSTMGIEMSASRLLAPFFGTSLFVWTNIIGLIMVALSLGYWLGGRWADRDPRPSVLYGIVMTAGVTCALIPLIARPVLTWSVRNLSVGIMVGSFAGTLLLFVPPIFFLGMVSPFAIRLAAQEIGAMGRVSGAIYALSTVGSIVGTFLPALVMIPLLGTARTMVAFAATLAAAGAVGLGTVRWWAVVGVLVLALPMTARALRPGAGILYESESPYNFIQVKRGSTTLNGRQYHRRMLILNEGFAVHSIYYEEGKSAPFYPMVSNVWDFMAAVPYLAHPTDGRFDVCLVGLAAGTITKEIHHFLAPQTRLHMDGVEIDPGIIDAGRRFFAMNEPTLEVHTQDGRQYLAHAKASYDVILTDAYKQPYIPFQLTTREYFTLVADHLKPGGVMGINVGSTGPDERVLRLIRNTIHAVFPHVAWIRVRNSGAGFDNYVVIAGRQPLERTRFMPVDNPLLERVVRANPGVPLTGVLGYCASQMVEDKDQAQGEILTDDRAPVELLTDAMILRYISSPEMIVPKI